MSVFEDCTGYCLSDDDCECYESCEASFCADITDRTGGCDYYDGCDGSTQNCNNPLLCFDNTDSAILEACEDSDVYCHVLVTCPWS